jgi:hypothetical protein
MDSKERATLFSTYQNPVINKEKNHNQYRDEKQKVNFKVLEGV